MKKILIINSLPNGSTGKIMFGIKNCAEHNSYKCLALYGNWSKYYISGSNIIRFGTKIENIVHALLGKQFGIVGHLSHIGTRYLLSIIDKFKPDIVHIHNIHLWVLNYPMLFRYLYKQKIKIVWTLHDCWAFTGHCPYFTLCGCNRWKNGCYDCPQLGRYPFAKYDWTKQHWNLKKKIFDSIEDLTIVTPSKWLASLVRESFLNKKRIRVINNGIDISIFRPYDKTAIRKKYNIANDHFVILGVAFEWEERKGLDVFIRLANTLDKSKFVIVLVGTNSKLDKLLPKSIVSIHRTNNQIELAQLFSMSDVYLNPTREDNYPTVNMEAIACGTPVITFNTGGSPEMLSDKTGIVIGSNSFEETKEIIDKVYSKEIQFNKEDFQEAACRFNEEIKYQEYIDLYNELLIKK